MITTRRVLLPPHIQPFSYEVEQIKIVKSCYMSSFQKNNSDHFAVNCIKKGFKRLILIRFYYQSLLLSLLVFLNQR